MIKISRKIISGNILYRGIKERILTIKWITIALKFPLIIFISSIFRLIVLKVDNKMENDTNIITLKYLDQKVLQRIQVVICVCYYLAYTSVRMQRKIVTKFQAR